MNIIKSLVIYGLLPISIFVIGIFLVLVIKYKKQPEKIDQLYLNAGLFLSILFTISLYTASIFILTTLKPYIPLLKTKTIILAWIVLPILPLVLSIGIATHLYKKKRKKRGTK